MILLTLGLIGCPEPGPPVYPDIGQWEGPGVYWNGTGEHAVPYPHDDFIEYRASVSWPDGVALDYPHFFAGTGADGEGNTPDLELELTDDALIGRIRPWGSNELPFQITLCGVERCALEPAQEFRRYELGQGPDFAYLGSTAEALFTFPDEPVLAVGERRPFQALPVAEYPFGRYPENSAPGTTVDHVAALEPPEYTIDDPTIASVDDDGTLTGVSVGTTTLHVTAGAASTSVRVEVTDEALAASPRGVLDLGPYGINRPGALGLSNVTLDHHGAPAALIRTQAHRWPDPALWLANNTAVLASWTGTGFGYEWLSQSNLDYPHQATLMVDGTGRQWVAQVQSNRAFGVSLRHRAAAGEPWERVHLPVRPDLDRGAEVPPQNLGAPAVIGPVVNLGLSASSRGGAWVAYQQAYVMGQTASYTASVWAQDAFELDCWRIVRLAHVMPDGTTELHEVKRTEYPAGCSSTGVSPASFVDPLERVWMHAEGPGGLPGLTVVEDPFLGGTRMDFSFDGTSWSESEHEPPVFGPDSYDPRLTVGGDPYGPVEGVAATNDRLFDLYDEAWRDGTWVGLTHPWDSLPDELLDRTHVIVYDGLRLRHDDSDALGRRLGQRTPTPRFSHDALVTDGCRLAVNNLDTSTDVAAPQWAPGRDTEWSDGALMGLVSQYPFVAERLVARSDAVYAVTQAGPLEVKRATNCQDFFALASVPDFYPDVRVPLLRDDGSVWVLTNDGYGGSVTIWDDPVLDPVAWTSTAGLVPSGPAPDPQHFGIRDAGSSVMTFLQYGGDLVVTEYDPSGAVLDAFVAPQPMPTQRVLFTNAMHRLDGGDWLAMRHHQGTNNGVELVRTSDFQTYEVLADDLWCGGLRNEAISSRWCAATLKLSDGRIAFSHVAPGELANQDAATIRLFTADGSSWTDIAARPHGGMTQGIHALHEEADGTVTAFMYDSHTYEQPNPGQVLRYADLVQSVVLP